MLSGGAYGAANAPHAVISPRYQAKTAYPILGGAPARPTAEASLLRGGQHTWRGPAFPRRRGITAAIGSINCGPKFAIARELLSLTSRQGVLMDYLPDQRADRGADPSSEHDIGAARTVSTPRTHGDFSSTASATCRSSLCGHGRRSTPARSGSARAAGRLACSPADRAKGRQPPTSCFRRATSRAPAGPCRCRKRLLSPTCPRRSPVRRFRGAAGLSPCAPRAPVSTEELSQ